MLVVIDPGHGGRDPGAVGPAGVQEKVVTLAVAKKAAEILQASGVNVRLTRDVDKHLGSSTGADLSARAKVANDTKADVFVSVHCNAAANRGATGTETFHYPGSSGGAKLAGILQRHLVAELQLPDRGVKQANFAVVRETKMPAALVELGFISNPAEEKLLKDPAFQARAAQAITAGIAEYLGVKLQVTEKDKKDVPSAWAENAWEWARREGYHDGTRPKDTITREEFMAILQRVIFKQMEVQ